MHNKNKLEKTGVALMLVGAGLVLIDMLLNLEYLNPILEFKDIIFYVGMVVWTLGLMQKKNLQKKDLIEKENEQN